MRRFFFVIFALVAVLQLSACAAAIGAGGVIIVDEVLEDENGDDGLF
ncbi:MAG: hypothetical protein AAF198_13450 [Pseudomonadota bacterium]